MKTFFKISTLSIVLAVSISCADKDRPNYQYMWNMYAPVGYETYQEVEFLPEGTAALVPAENSIARGTVPYEYENTPAGKEASRAMVSPLDSLASEANLAKGKELYDVYCGICHGAKGDGQGWLVQQEKILGVPSYADAARNINLGSTYHVIYYGLNSMGSYAGQLDYTERWQVTEYVMKLKADLTE